MVGQNIPKNDNNHQFLMLEVMFSVPCVPDLYRSSSNAGMAEFQEKLRLQHENSMHTELEKLLTTAKTPEAEVRPLSCKLCARLR